MLSATVSGVMMAPTSAPDGAWGSEENIWSRNTQYYSIVEAVVKQKQLESFRDLQVRFLEGLSSCQPFNEREIAL